MRGLRWAYFCFLEADMRAAISVIHNAEVRQMFERMGMFAKEEVHIVQSESFVSVYDASVSFQTAGKQARAISRKVDRPVLYATNFDDDVFIFGVFRSGKLITECKLGENLSVYDIQPKKLNVDKLLREVPVNNAGSLGRINTADSVDAAEKEVEKWLRLPLKLTTLDVLSEKERYIETFTDNGLYIYRKNLQLLKHAYFGGCL